MDIVELSRKMEADLLDSGPRKYYLKGTPEMQSFSPRQTRSRTGMRKVSGHIGNSDSGLRPTEEKVDELNNDHENKKHKTLNKNLETIYETPIWRKGCTMLLGNTKVKRSLYLNREFRRPSKVKSKLRKIKIKKMGKKLKLLKISDDEFRNKMLKIENFINETDIELSSNNGCCDNDPHVDDSNKKTDSALDLDMQE